MPAEDAVLKVLPEGKLVLAAGLLEAGEGIAAAAAGRAAGGAADLALLDVVADIRLTEETFSMCRFSSVKNIPYAFLALASTYRQP
ncbi:MAG: hypothetical protein IPK02_00785 [Candidatus Accumulibacter sp.]|uniref:Uncharacterized protein n=1 Tax=Candidatus Accumulibacter affinis TaxID=2954384 RepID=A0A935T7B2_9PROT|nr:hypothetical protein [Candidatus Accumulibacter affinis]